MAVSESPLAEMSDASQQEPLADLRQWLAEDGLINAATAELISLTGGVSCDVVLVRDGERSFVAKRALAKLRVKDDWFAGQLMRPTVPQPVNLRVDPFEQHMEAPYYPLYVGEKLWTLMPAGYLLQQHAATFEDFPPRQAPADFNPQEMLNSALHAAAGGIGNAT